MLVKDLFQKNNVKCPKWLDNIYLEDDWGESKYLNENGLHKWILKNERKNVLITFNGEEYHFIAFDDDGNIMFDNIVMGGCACDC